jgi:hypothetical protein
MANTTLKEIINWAINSPYNKSDCVARVQKIKQVEEKLWGNKMIGDEGNGQWTTKLGENLVFDILSILGENPRRVSAKNGFKPDWETDDYIYEVKTSNWWVTGTAGEKVLGTWIKYQDIPEIYGKPLRIVCIAKQEYELTYGKTPFFGPKVSSKTRQILDLAKLWNIEYITFSELVSKIPNDYFCSD